MKQTTLEDLYYGNINPCEISFVRGSVFLRKEKNVSLLEIIFCLIYNYKIKEKLFAKIKGA